MTRSKRFSGLFIGVFTVAAFWLFPLIALPADTTTPAAATGASSGWLADNWLLMGAILYAALSEIIGISPLKSNSLVQLILSVLGKIFDRRVVCLLIAMSLLLAACGGTAVLKTAEVTKETAEAALYQARILERQGKITPDQFAEAMKAYDVLRVAQGALIDAREAYLKSPAQDTQSALDAAVVTLAAKSAEFIDIARKYNIAEGTLWK